MRDPGLRGWCLRLRHSRRCRGLAQGLLGLGLALALAWWYCPQPELYREGLGFSAVLEDREGNPVNLALTEDGRYRLRTRLEDISPQVSMATLTLEDRHFYRHRGVNPLSMLRALWGVVTSSRQGGGSTITMQYARLRWGLHTRSWLGKGEQLLRALQLERHYSKAAILEAYLNCAPYGGNVEGIGAASLLWCGKSARELSLRESVALAVLPQSPTRRRPRVGSDNASARAAALRLWHRLAEEQQLETGALDEGFELRPEAKPPRELPHLARRLLSERAGSLVQRCTVDMARQRTLEQGISRYLRQRQESGLSNACALLVHAPSREVLGYVGSAAFLKESIAGQVDGVMARRSPGSALKPFVYALAMEQGLIHPRSLVSDARVSFADYNPENFDREFTGPITATDALFRSRNIPAVTLTQRLAPPGLYGFLKSSGVALPKPEAHYGLALPLGGAEVSMEELASLYCLLADDGQARPLRRRLDGSANPEPSGQPRLSAAARYLTRELLRARSGFEGVVDHELTWKTGTSHGFRDAWAAGILGEHVLVVWIGNFSGKGNAAFVARDSAAPLLFSLLEQLHLPKPAVSVPAGVAQVELCAVSGSIPTHCCEHRTMGGFIPGVSPIAPCTIHREVLLDPSTGLRVAREDGTRKLRREVYEFWPPDMLELYRLAGVPRREPPALENSASVLASSASQTPAASRDAPRIVSPVPHRRYGVSINDAQRQSIPLRVEVSAGVKQVFWFEGKRLLGSTPATEPLLWKASAGSHALQVIDDQGRAAKCEVQVEELE